MTDTNSTTLRNALAAAVKSHVESNGLTAKDAAATVDVQLSRFYQVLRGEVSKISSDALVNMLGGLGYRLTAINGSGDGTEIVLSLDKAEKVLPEIESPQQPYEGGDTAQSADGERWTLGKGGEFRVAADDFAVAAEATADLAEAIEAECDPDENRVVSADE